MISLPSLPSPILPRPSWPSCSVMSWRGSRDVLIRPTKRQLLKNRSHPRNEPKAQHTNPITDARPTHLSLTRRHRPRRRAARPLRQTLLCHRASAASCRLPWTRSLIVSASWSASPSCAGRRTIKFIYSSPSFKIPRPTMSLPPASSARPRRGLLILETSLPTASMANACPPVNLARPN